MHDKQEYDRLYYQRNKAKRHAQMKAWREDNVEAIAEISTRYYAKNTEELKAARRERSSSPKGAFNNHKNRAKQSGIPFNMAFDEWWSVWESHWESRRDGQYLVMARTRDEGAYELGNVRIATQSENQLEAYEMRLEKAHGQ